MSNIKQFLIQAFLCGILLVCSSITAISQISLTIKNRPVREVIKEIEKVSDYRFFYNDELVELNTKISVNTKDNNIKSVLDQISHQASLSYILKANHQVVLSSIRTSQAEKISITGIVVDVNGQAVIGANVVEKGTTNGTITDTNGNFSLFVNPGVRIEISYIGYLSKELIIVSGKHSYNVQLTEDAKTLDEVVVVGYGTMKKKDLTGSVAAVKGDDIVARKTMQLSTALQGSMSGVMVTRSNSAPGASATINIRGITTIGDSNPLVIVDGVPVDGLDDINPNDVENISVLKDAASAAIYGARAAAGVVQVTTKRAQTDQLALDYTFEYGFEHPTKLPEYAPADRYMRMVNELRWNDAGNGDNEYPTYAREVVDNYYEMNRQDPNKYPNTDWAGMILKNTAPRQSHVLSLVAGNKTVRTKATLGYDRTDGLYADRFFERFTARVNNDIHINKFLLVSLDFYFRRSKDHQPVGNPGDPINKIRVSPAIYPAVWADGRIANGKQGENIYAQMLYGGSSDNWYNQIGGKASIDFAPLKGLKISAIVAPVYNFDKGKKFKKRIPYYSADDPNEFAGYLNNGYTSTMLEESRTDNYRVTTQLIASYMRKFGDHDISIMGGYENYYAFAEALGAARDKYELESYPYLDLGPLEYRNNSGNAVENAYHSFFGRVTYSYRDKYLFQANIRHDGSSRFHSKHRWGTYPSFSAGWVVSEESFMKEVTAFSFLKLRASWGALGNERIYKTGTTEQNYYLYQSTIGFSNALFYRGNTIVSAQSAAEVKYAIEDISWEKTESFDIGLDATFLNNRLRFTADYYKKKTRNMLLALEIPKYMGYQNPDQNAGEMVTKGFELDLGWNDSWGDLRYGISVNLSDFRSRMGNLSGTEFLGDQVKMQGSEFNEWYGYVSDGIFQTQEEVDNSPKLNNSVKPGDVKYVDISGPDGKPDGIISPDYDRKLLGGSLPRYIYGGNLTLGYKGFDLLIGFQGIGKQNIRYSEQMVRPFISEWGNMPMLIDGKYWSCYNTEVQNREAQYPRLSTVSATTNYTMSDFWLFNGAYFRMKNLTLGYTIPSHLTQKIYIKNLRIYATATDLFSISKYPKGWDPEAVADGYPITQSFIFGLSVKF